MNELMTPVTNIHRVMLRCDQVVRRYPMGDAIVTAVRGISLEVHRGEYVALTGPSGSFTSSRHFELVPVQPVISKAASNSEPVAKPLEIHTRFVFIKYISLL